MITVSSPVLVGSVQVETTQQRGWSVEELAARAADKIIYVGDQSHPAVQAQARAFKESVKHVVADRKSTRLNSSHSQQSRMPSSA